MEKKNSAFLILEGKQYYAIDNDVVRIGRNPDNDLVVSDLRVSRRHAQLIRDRGEYLIMDTNSSGGTFVNGQPVAQKELQDGDIISLALCVRMTFQRGGDMPSERYRAYQPEEGLEGNRQTETLEEKERQG